MKEVPPYLTSLTVNKAHEKRFFFESIGRETILKSVIYSFAGQINTNLDPYTTPDIRDVYNLGFGDYDKKTKDIEDTVNSNNGDMWKVFSTILATVLDFFDKNPIAVILVSGSDSDQALSHDCRLTCRKKCSAMCRNIDRRIKAYKGFVNSNFDTLVKDYVIFGTDNTFELKPYEVEHQALYSSVLLCKRD